jgi:hypothetical protein
MFKTSVSLLIIFTGLNQIVFTQSVSKKFYLSGGMGICYGNSPSFTDYLRKEIPYSDDDTINSYNTGVEFFICTEYLLHKNISVKLDYSYFIRSTQYTYQYYIFDFIINTHQPYLYVNYVMKERKYRISLGAGIGYHYQLLENIISSNQTERYNSHGPSVRTEIIFSPSFSKTFTGYLTGFLYGNFYGDLKKSDGNYLKATGDSQNVSLRGFGAGIRLGVTFIL